MIPTVREWALAALFAAAAGAGLAQDVGFSAAPVERCLAAAEDGAAREACVGKAAEVCIASPAGDSNVGIGACYGQEAAWWEDRLDASFATLLTLDEKAAAELAALGSAAPSPAMALVAMQQAWVAWRDAACAYEESQWGGGSGGGPAAAACEMTMNGRQAIALDAALARATGP